MIKMNSSMQYLDSISSFPRVFTGFMATATGAVGGAIVEIHPLQVLVWVATIAAGLTTCAIGIIRLYLDIKKSKQSNEAQKEE